MAFSMEDLTNARQGKAPRILVHGVPGIGKSTFAATMPRPVFIQAEDGLAGIDAPAFPLAEQLSDIIEQLGVIYQNSDQFSTVVIDTIDAVERLIFKQVARDHDQSNIEDIGYGKGYLYALSHWQQMLQALNALRDKGLAVCLLCHTSVKRFNSPITESYDRYELALHKAASALLVEWCDVLGFANWQVMTKSEDQGFNKKQTKGIGTGQRKLHLVERPAWIAKNRFGLPDDMNFNWPELAEALNPQEQ